MRKIAFCAFIAVTSLALCACKKEKPTPPAQETPVAEESLTPEQYSKLGEAQGAVHDAPTIKDAYSAYQAKTIGFAPRMREQVDIVYDARFAEAVIAAKGDRAKINILREYIITYNNRGCIATSNCDLDKPS